MICRPCRQKEHDICKEENKGKTPSSCDCQHRTNQKTIVLPERVEPKPIIILTLPVNEDAQ